MVHENLLLDRKRRWPKDLRWWPKDKSSLDVFLMTCIIYCTILAIELCLIVIQLNFINRIYRVECTVVNKVHLIVDKNWDIYVEIKSFMCFIRWNKSEEVNKEHITVIIRCQYYGCIRIRYVITVIIQVFKSNNLKWKIYCKDKG